MNMKANISYLLVICIGMISCSGITQNQKEKNNPAINGNQELTILEKVDALDNNIKKSIADFNFIASLDHHRMAMEEGAYTPPAIVTIFSDPRINSNLLTNKNQLLGLDLPFKILCYSEPDTTSAKVAYTSFNFIAKRHGISEAHLSDFSNRLNNVLGSVDKTIISETNLDLVTLEYGIIKVRSDFDFETTLEKLVQIVNAQSDTRWFGEIDFQKEAKEYGKDLNPIRLLLFGGPAPGAKAMMTSPKIGLDAFCQKLLVYEMINGEVWIAINDIVDFSNLYYSKATKPQQMINQRLITTFTEAIQLKEN